MSKLVQVFYKDIPDYTTMLETPIETKETDINALIDKVNKANGGIDNEYI